MVGTRGCLWGQEDTLSRNIQGTQKHPVKGNFQESHRFQGELGGFPKPQREILRGPFPENFEKFSRLKSTFEIFLTANYPNKNFKGERCVQTYLAKSLTSLDVTMSNHSQQLRISFPHCGVSLSRLWVCHGENWDPLLPLLLNFQSLFSILYILDTCS